MTDENTTTTLLIALACVGLLLLVAFGVIPPHALIVIMFLLAALAGALATLKHYGVLVAYTATTTAQAHAQQPPQRLLLTDARHSFAQRISEAINALPMPAQDKQRLYQFTIQADDTLAKLMHSEKIPVALSDVRFGALTVTFRLRLREFSRTNLDRLMKLDNLVAQALSVETVRLIQVAGFVNCEVSSPVRAVVDVRALQASSRQTTVAIGLDTLLRPATIDVSQHGLIAAIAPSRRGKTQAIRTMLYLLKRANPSLNLVIVAFKSADWACFNDSAALILDKEEISQFCQWITQEMYKRAKSPSKERWIVVFDDLVNLLQVNPSIADTVKELASLGAGTGITTIVSTQFSGKDSGGTGTFANATCRLMFKPSSNLQAARDGGMANLGLDQLSSQKGDALLIVDGETTRLTTAMTADSLIEVLQGDAPVRAWLQHVPTATQSAHGTTITALTVHPFEQAIEALNGWLLDEDVFDWETGRFANKSEALRRLGWHNNTHYRSKLAELEGYIFQQSERF